jgi:hypothetical protein
MVLKQQCCPAAALLMLLLLQILCHLRNYTEPVFQVRRTPA